MYNETIFRSQQSYNSKLEIQCSDPLIHKLTHPPLIYPCIKPVPLCLSSYQTFLSAPPAHRLRTAHTPSPAHGRLCARAAKMCTWLPSTTTVTPPPVSTWRHGTTRQANSCVAPNLCMGGLAATWPTSLNLTREVTLRALLACGGALRTD